MAVEGSTIVNRPVEEIFDRVASARFIQQVISPSWLQKNAGTPAPQLYQLTEGAMRVGTKFRQEAGASDRPLEVTVEVVTYQRPTTFTFELTRGLNVTSFKWTFKPKIVAHSTAALAAIKCNQFQMDLQARFQWYQSDCEG